MNYFQKPSYLRFTNKETGEVKWVDGLALYRQPSEERNRFLKEHYHYQVDCCCQKEPIRLVLSHATDRTTGTKTTYFLKNTSNGLTSHHPFCRFHGSITHESPIIASANEKGSYELSIHGFKHKEPKNNHETTSSSKNKHSNPTQDRHYHYKSSIEEFSIQWNLILMRRKNNLFLKQKQTSTTPIFPSWKSLLNPTTYDLKSFKIKGSSDLRLHDLYLAYPSSQGIQEQQQRFKKTHPKRLLDHCFLTQGQFISYEPPKTKEETMGLLKLKTTKICYLWIEDTFYQQLLRSQSLTVDFTSNQVIWWFTLLIPPVIPTKKATINGKTFPIPVIKSASLIPLAKNGWWIENEAQCECFNQALNKKHLIQRPSQTDYRPLIPLKYAPTFYWIHPEATSDTPVSQKYFIGQISFVPKQSDYHSYWEIEKERLSHFRNLKNISLNKNTSFWHWNPYHQSECPSFPTFPPLNTKKPD